MNVIIMDISSISDQLISIILKMIIDRTILEASRNEYLMQLMSMLKNKFEYILQMLKKHPDSKLLRKIFAKAIEREMKSDRSFAEAITYSLNKYIFSLEQKVNTARESGKLNEEVSSVMMLAEIYLLRGNWSESLQLYNNALNIFSENNDYYGQCHALIGIGNSYDKQGNFSEAMGTYKLALDVIKQGHETIKQKDAASIESEILNNIANINVQERKWTEAVINYKRALYLYNSCKDMHSECETLMNMGVAFREKGDLEESLDLFEDALGKSQRIGDIYIENTIRVNLANTYFCLNQYPKADDEYKRSLLVLEALKDQQTIATVKMNLGSICYVSKQYNESLKWLNDCLEIYRSIADKRGECIALLNRGNVYRDTLKLDNSFNDFYQSLEISRMLRDRFNEGQIMRNLGKTHLIAAKDDASNLSKAISAFTDALEIFKNMGNAREEVALLINRAIAYANNQQVELAKGDLIDAKNKSQDNNTTKYIDNLRDDIERQSGRM
jgi:tetratricopeptide (TPR) repeat protein